MCFCGKSTVNGQPGAYSWDGKTFGTHPAFEPELREGEVSILFEPGRCCKVRGIDCHCHNFALVKGECGSLYIACRHGGGTVSYPLAAYAHADKILASLDSDGRYWLMYAMWNMAKNAAIDASKDMERKWCTAIFEKRTKIRRRHGRRYVEIVPAIA